MTATQTPPNRAGWDEAALADPHAQRDKAARVQAMFDAIAPTYERVNRVVSLGMDARWRSAAIRLAEIRATDVVADLCCGTGDMIRALAAHKPAPRLILGVDFAANMLARGLYGDLQAPVQLIRADALRLPLADESMDALTCAFGVRNFQSLERGLAEMRRVLRPGGRAVILEFALPENPLVRWGYRRYCEAVLPRLGTWISRDRSGAYRYLPKSIATFERRSAMVDRLRRGGFSDVVARPMNLGGVVVYRAVLRP